MLQSCLPDLDQQARRSGGRGRLLENSGLVLSSSEAYPPMVRSVLLSDDALLSMGPCFGFV